jgi:radical SAM protein with 4Fe4S-binding SPASM domain
MRADIFDLVSYAHDKGLWVVMSPSGTAVDGSIVERMKSSGVRRISLSLDGSSPEVHDTFRKVPGSFDRLINAVRHAREGELPFQINTTVSQWNIADLQKIYALVREIGAATWDVFLLVPTGRGKVELEITPGQYEEVLRYLATIEKEGAIPVKVTCAPHYVRIASEMQVEKAARLSGCMAGKGFAFVSHTGDVFGCGYLPISAGNIRERPFSRIYAESKLFNQLRDSGNLKGKCSACPWRFRCGGCRARAYGVAGDVLEAEPFCLYEPGGVGNV